MGWPTPEPNPPPNPPVPDEPNVPAILKLYKSSNKFSAPLEKNVTSITIIYHDALTE